MPAAPAEDWGPPGGQARLGESRARPPVWGRWALLVFEGGGVQGGSLGCVAMGRGTTPAHPGDMLGV